MIDKNPQGSERFSTVTSLLRSAVGHDVASLFLIVLCVTLFHWRGIQPGFTFLPVDLAGSNLPWGNDGAPQLQNVLVSDPLYQFYPFLDKAVKTVRNERLWPIWNPRIMLGHPAVGDPLTQPFFPLLLILGLGFGAARGYAVGLWLLAVTGAFLTYGWLRVTECTPLAAFVGGMTYALSGYMVTWFETPFWLSTLALLPGVLLTFDLARATRNLRYVSLAALLFGLTVLGGQLQFIIIFVLFLGLYAIGRGLESRRTTGRFSFFPIVILAPIVTLGIMLSGVFLLPAAELLAMSRRVTVSGLNDALPWQQLVTLIVPDFYGTPITPPYYWGSGNYGESTIYAGLVSLLLAVLAPFTCRKFFTAFLASVTIAITYFIVGGPGISLLGWIPGIQYASLHRTAFILPLLIAYLSAQTLSAPAISFRLSLLVAGVFAGIIVLAFYFDLALARSHWVDLRPDVTRAALLLLLALTLIGVAGRFRHFPSARRWGLAGLVFVDLFLFGSRFNPAGPIEELMPRTEAIDFLVASQPQRVVALQRDDRVLFGPNVLSLFDLTEAGGYSSLVNDRYHQLVSAADPELDVWWMNRQGNMVTFSNPSLRLLDMFQVSHVVAPEPIDVGGVRSELVNDACIFRSRPISSMHPVSGSFSVQDTAINRIDFRFLAVGRGEADEADLVIRLWQGDKAGRLVAESRQTIEEASEAKQIVVFFTPEKNAPGQTYLWEVSSDAEQTAVTVCLGADGRPAVSVYGSDWAEIYGNGVYIYERLAPMSRAYVVYAAEHSDDEVETVQRLLQDRFPIRHMAVTHEEVPLPATVEILATPASIIEYTDTRVTVQAEAVRDGLLILGDQFHPGWQVTVDGQSAKLLRVNHIFRGVMLPSGEHEISFRFNPWSLRVGVLLTAIGIAFTFVLALVRWETRSAAEPDRGQQSRQAQE